jgi:hypothetical protein
MLVLRAVAGHVAHLGQRVVEARALGSDRQLLVVVKAPVGALVDCAGDQSTADVGQPVGEPATALSTATRTMQRAPHIFICILPGRPAGGEVHTSFGWAPRLELTQHCGVPRRTSSPVTGISVLPGTQPRCCRADGPARPGSTETCAEEYSRVGPDDAIPRATTDPEQRSDQPSYRHRLVTAADLPPRHITPDQRLKRRINRAVFLLVLPVIADWTHVGRDHYAQDSGKALPSRAEK